MCVCERLDIKENQQQEAEKHIHSVVVVFYKLLLLLMAIHSPAVVRRDSRSAARGARLPQAGAPPPLESLLQ